MISISWNDHLRRQLPQDLMMLEEISRGMQSQTVSQPLARQKCNKKYMMRCATRRAECDDEASANNWIAVESRIQGNVITTRVTPHKDSKSIQARPNNQQWWYNKESLEENVHAAEYNRSHQSCLHKPEQVHIGQEPEDIHK